MLGNGTEQGYIDSMQATANTGILIAMFAAVIVTATISALIGSRMLNRLPQGERMRMGLRAVDLQEIHGDAGCEL